MNKKQKIFAIIAELEELSTAIDHLDVAEPVVSSGPVRSSDAPYLTARGLRAHLRALAVRKHFFRGDLFADPAWIMIIHLMAARLSGTSVTITQLCEASMVPQTTALRWIQNLVSMGKFERKSDPADGRRVFIVLSDEMAEAFTSWHLATRRDPAGDERLL